MSLSAGVVLVKQGCNSDVLFQRLMPAAIYNCKSGAVDCCLNRYNLKVINGKVY